MQIYFETGGGGLFFDNLNKSKYVNFLYVHKALDLQRKRGLHEGIS